MEVGLQSQSTSEYENLYSKLSTNPRIPDAWHRLIRIAEDSQDIASIRTTYDIFLAHYPNNTPAQLQYLDHCLQRGLNADIQNLFKKFLRNSPDVGMWKRYIEFVRGCNSADDQRHHIKRAYEFTIDHIGQDKDSGPIWFDYLTFLRE
ncbi:hypothetical protein CVT26_016091, partial [Gymnopilus dilepis]